MSGTRTGRSLSDVPAIGCAVVFFGLCLVVCGVGLHNFVGDFVGAIAPTPPYIEDASQQVEASEDNFVVSARHVVTNQGHLSYKDRSGAYVAVGPSWQPLPGPTTHCVFVHGFNTTAVRAVDYGNALVRMLSHAMTGGAHRRLVFHTFLWRGDLGESHYGASEIAAKTSAASLLAFVRDLSKSQDHRVVVIAHSLGSEVVLEAARMAPTGAKFLEALLLFQPAVSWERLATGEYLQVIPADRDTRRPIYFTAPLKGDFRVGLDAIGKVDVTQSSGDTVLSFIRGLRKTKVGAGTSTPDPMVALGVPAFYGSAQFHPRIRLHDLSPGNQTGVAIRDHSELFASDAIFLYLWEHALRDSFALP